jgi:hypothetical protein
MDAESTPAFMDFKLIFPGTDEPGMKIRRSSIASRLQSQCAA